MKPSFILWSITILLIFTLSSVSALAYWNPGCDDCYGTTLDLSGYEDRFYPPIYHSYPYYRYPDDSRYWYPPQGPYTTGYSGSSGYGTVRDGYGVIGGYSGYTGGYQHSTTPAAGYTNTVHYGVADNTWEYEDARYRTEKDFFRYDPHASDYYEGGYRRVSRGTLIKEGWIPYNQY